KPLRSAAGSAPSRPISSATRPLRPKAAMRASSRALSSPAAAISARRARSSAAMSMSCAILSSSRTSRARPKLPATPRPDLRRVRTACACKASFNKGRAVRTSTLACGLGRAQLRGSLLAQRLESGGILDGEIGQHFAVDGYSRLVEAIDKSAVGHAMLAHGRIDALDPEPAKGALLALAVAVAILQCLFHRLLGDADGVLAPAIVALGLLQDFLVLCSG